MTAAKNAKHRRGWRIAQPGKHNQQIKPEVKTRRKVIQDLERMGFRTPKLNMDDEL